MQETTTLKTVPLFAGLADPEIISLRALMSAQHYVPGQMIIREGEPGDLFHIIVKGAVEYVTSDADGHDLILDQAGEGAFFGELSMITGEPRVIRVRAKDQVDTLALDRRNFFEFLIAHPSAAIDVLKTLGYRLYTTDKLLRQSVSKNVNEVMEEKQTFSQKIADTIASFSGTITFLMINAVWFAGWMIWNQDWFPAKHFDPFPFGLLTMIVSLEAIFLSIFVMISQNRQAATDRTVAEIDHQVNVRAEVKTGLIMNRLDDIERSMHFLHAEQAEMLKKMKP